MDPTHNPELRQVLGDAEDSVQSGLTNVTALSALTALTELDFGGLAHGDPAGCVLASGLLRCHVALLISCFCAKFSRLKN